MNKEDPNWRIIKKEDILFIATFPNKDRDNFLIYKDNDEIHVSANFKTEDDTIYAHAKYDRILSNSVENLKNMSYGDITYIAYCAYMDGAKG